MSDYTIHNFESYKTAFNKSVTEPESFWENIAKDNFTWNKPWSKVLEWDFNIPKVSWFKDAKLNITVNCIDRHLNKNGNRTAIIFEPNNPNDPPIYISYKELSHRVNKMANVFKSLGVKKGDRVCLYLPMIPELAVAVLACARIGAIHSVVFAGFSSRALATRIKDCDARLVLTSDGSLRGEKEIQLKPIVDEALLQCPNVSTVLVVKHTKCKINMHKNRDYWLSTLLNNASEVCPAELMDAEDPLFILYTSGSTGSPKGMVHSIGGYMVYTAYTFKTIFQYKAGDVYWCTADIGWITGHSYILYGPLLNGATTLMFEGVPSYPDYGRFWSVVDKYKVNQFYTAPTAIRALAKQGNSYVTSYDLSSLKVIGTVGEPINEEAWQWYFKYVGKQKCPVVDTWWQTETGGIMISPIPNCFEGKPTFATLPFIGVQAVLMDDNGDVLHGPSVAGRLAIAFPWPSMARSIWGNHQRYRNTYFKTFKNHYFTGDAALRDENGHYRITGRVDDVIIVSGHNLGTAPIEDAINEHPAVAESAIVGYTHQIKGNALYGFVTLKSNSLDSPKELKNAINRLISSQVGPIAKLDKIQFTSGLPKTRSGKIMRRILRKIANNSTDDLGDITTLLNPEIVAKIITEIE